MRVDADRVKLSDDDFMSEEFGDYDAVECKGGKIIIFAQEGMIMIDEDIVEIRKYPVLMDYTFRELQEQLDELSYPWIMIRLIKNIKITLSEE